MKALSKSRCVQRRHIRRAKTERAVLSLLNHPFIAKMHYAFQVKLWLVKCIRSHCDLSRLSPQDAGTLFFVLDFCAGGELFFHLSRLKCFSEPMARFYAAEVRWINTSLFGNL